MQEEIVDLILDNDPSANPSLCILTPYSDYYVVLADY